MDADPFDLNRFVEAQAQIYGSVINELSQGHKTGHWMWYIFPQHRSLGRSAISKAYGISGLHEAEAYAAHPILGSRLRECTNLILNSNAESLTRIFGPDDVKFKSCMTLFSLVHANRASCYHEAINRWCAGFMDQATVDLICADEYPPVSKDG